MLKLLDMLHDALLQRLEMILDALLWLLGMLHDVLLQLPELLLDAVLHMLNTLQDVLLQMLKMFKISPASRGVLQDNNSEEGLWSLDRSSDKEESKVFLF